MELLGLRPQKMFLRSAEKGREKMGDAKVKKINRRERQVGSKVTRKLQVLWKTITSEKL